MLEGRQPGEDLPSFPRAVSTLGGAGARAVPLYMVKRLLAKNLEIAVEQVKDVDSDPKFLRYLWLWAIGKKEPGLLQHTKL
eukprot:5895534-Lingulodinium_polyedra.AAC.1